MKQIQVIILGRLLGTASGWDGADDPAVAYYDFEPEAGVRLQAGSFVEFSLDTGNVVYYNEDGDKTVTVDLVSLCQDIPKMEGM